MAPQPSTEYTIYRGIEGAVKEASAHIKPLGPKEILVKITHSGLCGTDLAYVPYGIALGHEGVGIVEAIGSDVTQFEIGDRAGDIWCYERSIYGEEDYANGTFGEYYIGTETYLHKIPEGLTSEHAAPLQCAGATVYNALFSVAKPAERVGIIGIGGLGHLAIQFARKLGAEVVVFSTSRSKEEEAKEFGASEFYLLEDIDKVKKPVNVLVIAGNRYPDWKKFLVKEVVARAGTIIPLAAPNGNISLPAFRMFFDGYNVLSSLVASRAKHEEMLAFAASHDIKPTIEQFDLSEDGLQEAIAKLKSNNMRYRGVLVAKGA